MKETTLEQLAQNGPGFVEAAQRERILVTRDGKPVAVLLGLEHKDLEDARLETSEEFWQMIAERRGEVANVPLEQVEQELWAGKNLPCRYSMVIQWSDEDQVYVVTLPEFHGCKTHGATYEEAARRGQETLESLIETFQADGQPLPEPVKFGSAVS